MQPVRRRGVVSGAHTSASRGASRGAVSGAHTSAGRGASTGATSGASMGATVVHAKVQRMVQTKVKLVVQLNTMLVRKEKEEVLVQGHRSFQLLVGKANES